VNFHTRCGVFHVERCVTLRTGFGDRIFRYQECLPYQVGTDYASCGEIYCLSSCYPISYCFTEFIRRTSYDGASFVILLFFLKVILKLKYLPGYVLISRFWFCRRSHLQRNQLTRLTQVYFSVLLQHYQSVLGSLTVFVVLAYQHILPVVKLLMVFFYSFCSSFLTWW